MYRIIFLNILMLLFSLSTFAQSSKKKENVDNVLFNANKEYNHQAYKEAKSEYEHAIKKNNSNPISFYNRGNASFQLKQMDEARKDYKTTIGLSKDKTLQAKAYHNIGNTFMEEKKWQEAVDAYKNALRKNPTDLETKYNLVYAQKMLQNNQDNNKNNKDKDNKEDKKDKDKENKNNKDDKEDKEKPKQDPSKDNEKEDEKDEKKEQQQDSQMNEQKANQLLNAIQQEERKVQEKKGQKSNQNNSKLDKDW